MTTADPLTHRAQARAAVAADPAAAARVAAAVQRVKRRPTTALRQATRACTEAEQWADFDAAEARNERERDRRS